MIYIYAGGYAAPSASFNLKKGTYYVLCTAAGQTSTSAYGSGGLQMLTTGSPTGQATQVSGNNFTLDFEGNNYQYGVQSTLSAYAPRITLTDDSTITFTTSPSGSSYTGMSVTLFAKSVPSGGTLKELVGYRFEAGVSYFSIFASPTHNLYGSNHSWILANSEYFESNSTGLGGVLKARKSCKVLHLENDVVIDTTDYSAGDIIFTYPSSNVYTQYHNWIVL